VIGQRNVVIHEYHRLDLDAIWAVATEDVPQLQAQLESITPPQLGPSGRRSGLRMGAMGGGLSRTTPRCWGLLILD